MNMISVLLYLVFFILAGLPCIYLVVSTPAVIIWKIYRKIKYGYKLTD